MRTRENGYTVQLRMPECSAENCFDRLKLYVSASGRKQCGHFAGWVLQTSAIQGGIARGRQRRKSIRKSRERAHECLLDTHDLEAENYE